MRKFTKICLVASFILILVGGTICAIGAATGGWRLAQDYGRDSKWTRFVWSVPEHYRWSFWKWEDWDEITELDDLDDIVDRELKFFVLADENRWGFTVVPVLRERGQLQLGPDQFFRF